MAALVPPVDVVRMDESPPIYLNIVVVDAKQAVESKITQKLGAGFFSAAGSAVAKSLVTESKIATKIAGELATKIPTAVAEMGITMKVEKKFQIGSFVVLKATISEVETLALVKFAKGQEFAESFEAMLGAFRAMELSEAIGKVGEKIRLKVHAALVEKLAERLPLKLSEMGISTTCQAKSSPDQAEFFFDFMAKLNP
mmetsp:Transcript_8189/g.18678  ORF Transcript_8189/g.18678 Transcript_8189/m.18678 type:complete len:198 (-) Transcript_8189:433-1026(-)|eukprot:CAMPEP_0172611472 /NCGR_PEP_ID=MMETSP1068-20121228/31151_1 /TAXON_ID=35684 /ORGANISM="Pseudopedinella elastica, Strain CCMP716" /LENGTH=197 /DNA_ID=CAMNT_0013415449 /DNA_START=77 /DNA_END=670 /DNA_ORIENTATION=+